MRRMIILTTVVSSLAVLAFSAASASAAEPWWHIESGARPTYLPPPQENEQGELANGKGELVVTATNLGNAPTSGVVTVTDTLPAGLKALAITGNVGIGNNIKGLAVCPTAKELKAGAPLTCRVEGRFTRVTGETVPATVAPYDEISLLIKVEVLPGARTCEPGASTCEQNEVSVSGGGAPSVSVARPVTISEKPVPFGVESYEVTPEEEGGQPANRAGEHPFQVTGSLTLNQTASSLDPFSGDYEVHPVALAKDLIGLLPPGLVGNPTPFPPCKLAAFYNRDCSQQSVVGVALVTYDEDEIAGLIKAVTPIVVLEPAHGEPARFGFFTSVPTILDTHVRAGGDYGITLGASDIPQAIAFIDYKLVFWGVPGASAHDSARGGGCIEALYGKGTEGDTPCTPVEESAPPPLLVLPTSCEGPLHSSTEADSWAEQKPEGQRPIFAESQPMPAMQGCSQLPFEPSVKVTPDGNEASTPTGLTVDVHVPQESILNARSRAESSLRDTTVALPAGFALNPSDAGGLEACSEGLVGYEGARAFETSPGLKLPAFTPQVPGGEGSSEALQPGINFCANAAKIGTVKIKTPLLPPGQPLEGSIYLASQEANPFGSLLALYIVAEDPISGSLVKLSGEVTLCKGAGEVIDGHTCEALGQIVTTVQDTPQVAFEDFEAHFFGGERAPLASPARCGAYTTYASFTPWAAEPWDEAQETANASSTFPIDAGPNHAPCPGASLPFDPSATGGATNVQAGAFSPFTATFSRSDGEQNMQSIQVKLPPGLSGVLSAIELCPEPQANLGTCGANSLIGETTVSVGVGGQPYSVRGGKFYLTGPYNGTGSCTVGEPGCAPFGVTFVVPAKAGPFDFANTKDNHPACDCVLVRGKIEINPETAAITITSNPPGTPDAVPTSIEGVPLEIQHINATTTRSSFQFNPTNCSKMQLSGSLLTSEGGSDTIAVPFQVTNCAALKFEPHFSVSTSAKTSRADGASLTAKVSYPSVPQGTDADLARVKVELPEQLPSRLTTLQKACTEAQFEANPAACPAASFIGHAVVHTPLVPVPLEGPAVFVSHGGEAFPSLELVLQGYGVKIVLVGTTFISKAGITSTTFKTVPDQPFSSFELTLPEGPDSALAAIGNLCAPTATKAVKKKVTVRVRGHKKTLTRTVMETKPASLVMPNEFVGQNGAAIHQNTTIAVTGCPTAKNAKAKTKQHKGGKKPKKK